MGHENKITDDCGPFCDWLREVQVDHEVDVMSDRKCSRLSAKWLQQESVVVSP